MKSSAPHTTFSVNSLALFCILALSACSTVNRHHSEVCKTRAYSNTNVVDYITTRYHSNAPVRVGIIPFSIPENLAGTGDQLPTLGQQLAWKIHQNLLASNELPIVEVLNRQGWPAQKAEFYSGNFEAITMARNAGYDLVLTGDISRLHGIDSITAATKLMETESGITIWYGDVTTTTEESFWGPFSRLIGLEEKVPSGSQYPYIIDMLAKCTADAVLNANRP